MHEISLMKAIVYGFLHYGIKKKSVSALAYNLEIGDLRNRALSYSKQNPSRAIVLYYI